MFDNSYQSTDVPQAPAAMNISGTRQNEWYPDFGATSHITNTTKHLHDTSSYSGSESIWLLMVPSFL